MKYKESLVSEEKTKKLKDLLLSVIHLNGDIAEIGVYKAGTAFKIALLENKNNIYLFDTFNGMPFFSKENDKTWGLNSFNDTSYEEVQSIFKNFNNIFIYKGVFPKETGYFIENKKFKFVHLDVDNYESYKQSLEFLYDKLIDGGIIVFDDYEELCCPGAKKAVDEFFKNKENILFNGTFYIKKQNEK